MEEIPEEVKLCMMQLINIDAAFGIDAQIANAPKTGAVASFNTDGYSESYAQVSGTDAAETAAALEKQATAQSRGRKASGMSAPMVVATPFPPLKPRKGDLI